MKKYLIGFGFMLSVASATAQIGGKNVYDFLTFSSSARTTALGGSLIMAKDDDAALGLWNPALLNETMSGQVTFSHAIQLANIQQGYAGYTHHLSKIKTTLSGGIQYADYGKFIATNTAGQQQGNFKANDWSLNVGAGRMLSDRTSIGANVRFIGSNLEAYNSYGAAIDLAANYADTAKRIDVAFVVRNLGTQFSTYAGKREKLPLDVMIGFSKRLKYLPLRFGITANNLQQWTVRYDDPNAIQETSLFGQDSIPNTVTFGDHVDNLFRHLTFSGELLIGKKDNFRLRIGYNHLRRSELIVKGTRGLAGFSFGFGMKIKHIRIDYAWAGFHLAGGMHHFTLSTNLHDW